MAKLLAYTVTSNLDKEGIKNAVLKNLKTAEKTAGTDAFSLTFDNNTKKLYMIFSEQMVSNNPNMDEHMVEIKPGIETATLRSLLNDVYASKTEIEQLRQAIEALDNVGDGGIIGDGSSGVSQVDLSAYYTKSQTDGKITEARSALESAIAQKADKSELAKYATKEELAAIESAGDGGVIGEPAQKTYEKFVVVGIWGQSNAVGYDESNLTLYDVSKDTSRIFQWGFGDDAMSVLGYCAKNHQDMNSSGVLRGGQQSVMAANRQGEPLNDPERFTNAKTKGIHLPLANLIIDAIPEDYGLVIVPAAYGGQSITTFLSGQRINTFAQNIKRALDTHDNSVLAGIIWCQGENDTGSMNKATYKGNFETLINNLKNLLAGYEKKSITGKVDASIWYNYEYPKRFKDNQYGLAILEAQKEVLGDRYTPIPDDVPVNLTQYCASNKPDHYAQDAFRTHIAPRVFEVMKRNGAFLSVGLPVESAGGEGAAVDVDAIKNELSSSFVTSEQTADFARKNELAMMVGELQSYHLWYEERIAQLEEAVRNGSRDIQTIMRMFDVTNDMLDIEGEWNTENGMIEYIGPRGGKPRSLIIATEDYDTVHFHNNVNAAWGLIVAYNTETGKYLWLYSDNNNVFMTDRTPSVSTAFTQQTNSTGSGTRNIIKQNTNLMIKREGTVITGENTGGTKFSIDIASNLAVLGNAESTKMYWGFAIAWSQTINKFDNGLPYWMDVKLSNQQG